MPIEPTPFEHELVVADAMYWTDPVIVAPLAGSLSVTPAKAAGVSSERVHTNGNNDFSTKPFSK